jgi:hypothetical protein
MAIQIADALSDFPGLMREAERRDAIFTPIILRALHPRCVIVGSWPYIHEEAKDVDLVVPERPTHATRHPMFEWLKENFEGYYESSAIGHLWLNAYPKPVEIFESDCSGFALPSGKVAIAYPKCIRRARLITCYGVTIRAVCEETQP